MKQTQTKGFLMLRNAASLVVLSFVVTACAEMPTEKPVVEVRTSSQAEPAAAGEPAADARPTEQSASERDRVEPVIYKGTDRQVRMPEAPDPVRLVGKDVSLNFEEAPLAEVVHAVLSDILNMDYIIDHPVQGKVTLRTRTPIPRDQLLTVLESLLQANNVLMVRGSDGRLVITGSQQARKMNPSVSGPGARGAGYTTTIIPLRYISAANMAEILKPVADESAFLRVDNSRNLLMMAGTQAQLSGWMDMINTFDVDLLKGMSVGLFPLEHSGVENTAEVLNGMLGGATAGGGGGGEGGGDFGQLVKIIPIKRLNSLLVVTPRAHYLDTVQTWIDRLDAAPDANFAKKLYVYPVQNTTASRLAELLNSIYSGGSGSKSTSSGTASTGQGSGGVAPGMNIESIGSSSRGGSGSSGGNAPASFTNTDQLGAGVSAMNVGEALGDEESPIEDVRVVADDENNSLMIYASGKQYELIKEALQQLDVVATQVIIEASILEVSLTEGLEYGLEWTFKNGIGNSYSGSGQLAGALSGPAAKAGFSYSITNSLGDISAVLNALARDSLINVISTPSVMVLDNQTAYIHVGNQVPVRTSRYGSVAGNSDSIIENIDYRDTGVKLTVRPSVNAGRLVTMDIAQSVTDLGEIDDATNQRSFLERNIQSRVAVRSDQAVVLGGLIQDNAARTNSGVPILKDIPGLGALFSSTDNESRRTELIVIITPRVIESESELQEVSAEMRSRLRNMELIDVSPN
ncbi:type II secretion system secretin GspD [Parahaliea mediterranea]|uniref:type II secretion system secretin GspD n=1 Tax=Parahaliea mediterranea TaxID=651086 RepID=UPI001F4DA892|nr:type II secretion system secretin GspD [Parahaliea mediterranea]